MNKNLGVELRKIRELKKIKQSRLAAHLGTTQQFVSQMELGFRPLTPNAIEWMIDALLVGKPEKINELKRILKKLKIVAHSGDYEDRAENQKKPRNPIKKKDLRESGEENYKKRVAEVLIDPKMQRMLVRKILKKIKIDKALLGEIIGSETFLSYDIWRRFFDLWFWRGHHHLCRSCRKSCKQSIEIEIESCPQYEDAKVTCDSIEHNGMDSYRSSGC